MLKTELWQPSIVKNLILDWTPHHKMPALEMQLGNVIEDCPKRKASEKRKKEKESASSSGTTSKDEANMAKTIDVTVSSTPIGTYSSGYYF